MHRILRHILNIEYYDFPLLQNVQLPVVGDAVCETIGAIPESLGQAVAVLLYRQFALDLVLAHRVRSQADKSIAVDCDELYERAVFGQVEVEISGCDFESSHLEVIAPHHRQEEHFISVGQVDFGLEIGEHRLRGIEL
jgi:hypothetical protein